MNRIEVNSSTIKTVGYSAEEHRLEVEFSSGGLYAYANVPQEVYDRFLASESKGHFFQSLIRPCYNCTWLNRKEVIAKHGEQTPRRKTGPSVRKVSHDPKKST